MIEITITTGRWFGRIYRRALPSSFREVQHARLLHLIQIILAAGDDEELRKIAVLQYFLDVPPSVLAGMSLDDLSAISQKLNWAKITTTAIQPISSFEVNGQYYFLPSDNFGNGSALEFALADDYCKKWINTGSETELTKLVATLCREQNKNSEEITKTGDVRTLLNSRSEAEARALKLKKLEPEIMLLVAYYFIGVKELINRVYGKYLFDNDEESESQQQAKEGTMFGWWGKYFELAGNITNLDKIYKTNFHTICMFLVKQRKEAIDEEMRIKMSSPNWGLK
jgi:hypothetical protein